MMLAGIDIGTNSTRLLVADVSAAGLAEHYSGRVVTRLGQSLDRTGKLDPDACGRTLSTLVEFKRIIAGAGVVATAAVGTSALRIASNRAAFLRAAYERTGIDVRIIDGNEEARLTMLGVSAALAGHEGLDGSVLVIDIGGGSTEIIIAGDGGALRVASLHLGAVYLTESLLRQDPPAPTELAALRTGIRSALAEFDRQSGFSSDVRPAVIAGTAGTITTLASMDQGLPLYDPAKINGSLLSKSSLDRITTVLASRTLKERRCLSGLEAGREDIILAGAVIAQEIMERYGYQEMLVSDWGLREGLVLDLHRRLSAADR